jgi:putative colanic acid biosynthesis UDP-glucose lipid carrier transferase
MASNRASTFLLQNLQRLVDLVVIFLAGYLTLYFRFWNSTQPNDYYDRCIYGACIIFALISSQAFNLESDKLLKSISRISKIWAICFLSIVTLILFTQSGNLISRIWLVLWGLVTWVFLILAHTLIEGLLQKLYLSKKDKKRISIIGMSETASLLIGKLKQSKSREYELVSHLTELNPQDIAKITDEKLDEIWISLAITEAGQLPIILNLLQHSAANIKYAPDLFTLRLINHGSGETLGVEMLNLNASPFSGEALILKNLEDFIFSFLILLFISPLMVLLVIAVKISSPGPIFYRQERVGLNGRPFMMLKFRSMPIDTEKDGAQWGGSDSKVVHPLAKWMRRLNLDELPQFINVLYGEMSIVGPRPERSEFIGEFRDQIPNYMKKHLVKAGITGWAQVHGLRGDTDLNQRIEYDLFYIENWSFKLDLKIILMTIISTLIPKTPPPP